MFAVDALRDGQQVYVSPIIRDETDALDKFDDIVGTVRLTRIDDETTVRLIREGEIIRETTLADGHVLATLTAP